MNDANINNVILIAHLPKQQKTKIVLPVNQKKSYIMMKK